MALETGTRIPELNPANPAGTDQKAQGDDHLRLVKACVTGSFPGFVGTTATPKEVTLSEDQLNDAALKSEEQFIDGPWRLNNNRPLFGRNFANDASVALVTVGTDDVVDLASSNFDTILRALATAKITINGNLVADFVPASSGGMLVIDRNGNPIKVGFRNPPSRVVTNDADDATQDDEGGIIRIGAPISTFNVPQLEAGTTFTILGTSSGFILTEGTGVTINFHDGRGSAPPQGDRTCERACAVQVRYDSPTSLSIWGAGIS